MLNIAGKKKENAGRILNPFIRYKGVEFTEQQFVCVLYFFCIILRFLSGAYLKHIETMPDEVLYRHMAESFISGRGFLIHNTDPNNTARILYSIAISPAYLFKNAYIQTYIIQLINSILISSTIFPYAMLTKKIIQNKNIRKAVYLMFLVLPELCQCVTYASENLFLPLTTWYIYIFVLTTEKKKHNGIRFNLLLGGWMFLLKLCKDASLSMTAGIVLYYIYESLREKRIIDKAVNLLYRGIDMIVVCGEFVVLCIIAKYSVFKNVIKPGNSISTVDLITIAVIAFFFAFYIVVEKKGDHNKIDSIAKVFVIVIVGIVLIGGGVVFVIPGRNPGGDSLFVDLFMNLKETKIGAYLNGDLNRSIEYALDTSMYVLMAVGILPIIIPALYYYDMNDCAKKVFVINTCMALAGVIFVTLYFSGRSMWNRPIPGSLRYISYLWLPYLITFFSMYEEKKEKVNIKKYIGFAVAMFVIIIQFKGARTPSSIDMDMLFYIVYHFTFVMWQLRIPMVLVAILTIIIYHKNRAWLFKLFYIGFVMICLLNNVLILKDHYERYHVEKEEYEDIKKLAEFITEHNDEGFILVQMSGDSDINWRRLSDTFVSGKSNVYTIYYSYLSSMIWDEDRNINDIEAKEPALWGIQKDIENADFLILPNCYKYDLFNQNVHLVMNGNLYDVYKLEKTSYVPRVQYY